jgi:uncharacterized protein (TIGR02246 family)
MEATEEQIIRGVTEKRIEAWNSGNTKTSASYFSEDAVRVGPYGDEQHGREEIIAAMEKMREKMEGATVRLGQSTVRLLGPEHAILHGGMEILLADGTSIKGHLVDVMKRVEGQWMILETHPKIIPPTPER